jgi:uncharacterized protein YecE (DUF72 family)
MTLGKQPPAPPDHPTLRVGTSGWIYRHWKAVFYPAKLPQRQWFEFYSQHFDTIEVNFTFYRLPAQSVFDGWSHRAPGAFVFALKGSQYITHMKRLLDPAPHVARFFAAAEPLKAKTGPVLWQLPPAMKKDTGRLDHFLEVLPTDYHHALEFRNDTWLCTEVYRTLERHGAALCVPDRPKQTAKFRLTADWTYARFHQGGRGGNYTDSQLRRIARDIAMLRREDVHVWAYFNNDPGGHAIRNAEKLRRLLESS